MGTFGTPSSYNNTGALGSATNPTTAQGLSRDRENQKAILELPGTQAWVEKTITDGVIIPTSAEVIVLPEGGAPTDSLTTIALTSDGTTTLHEGMPIRLKAANSNTITAVHGTGTNNISTIDGNNVVLDTTWYLELKLINGLWVQQETHAYKIAAASTGLTPRMDAAEQINTQQDTRLDAVESGVTALSTTLIGSVQSVMATDTYVPNGCVPANGDEYTRAQFPSLYDVYLAGAKLLTCTYAAWTAQVALTGNCAKFALDTVNQKFRVPLLKDGDSITQASSTAELGKSVKAGLPNAKGTFGYTLSAWAVAGGLGVPSGVFAQSSETTAFAGGGGPASVLNIDLSRANSIYGNSTTVTDEQVRLRHFVVVASAQNSASVFDWSAYMSALAGKANLDMDNLTQVGTTAIAHYAKPSNTRYIDFSLPASGGTYTPLYDGTIQVEKAITANGQYIQLSAPSHKDLKQNYNIGDSCFCSLEVQKGTMVGFTYTAAGTTIRCRFIIDEGAY